MDCSTFIRGSSLGKPAIIIHHLLLITVNPILWPSFWSSPGLGQSMSVDQVFPVLLMWSWRPASWTLIITGRVLEISWIASTHLLLAPAIIETSDATSTSRSLAASSFEPRYIYDHMKVPMCVVKSGRSDFIFFLKRKHIRQQMCVSLRNPYTW